MKRWEGILKVYQAFLPVTKETPMLTLYEGNTPLFFARHLSSDLHLRLFFKFEGMNPTGSFKDRGMVMAVAKAVEEGSRTVICASTGNTSAAASAYAAHAGLQSIVVIPNGKIAMGKLAQALMYGAEIVAIDGNFDEALKIVRDIAEKEPVTLVNSVNPYRIEGQQTAAFEVCEQLGEAPDVLAIPVGNAGNMTAYWKGFKAYYEAGCAAKMPAMWGFEAEGAAAIVKGAPILNPETVATAIRIGNPASWQGAVGAARESGGLIDAVSDEEILSAYRLLASTEGIFAEPASAASLAGVLKKRTAGDLQKETTVVCVLTGNGLKDPNTAVDTAKKEIRVVPGRYEEVAAVIRDVVKR